MKERIKEKKEEKERKKKGKKAKKKKKGLTVENWNGMKALFYSEKKKSRDGRKVVYFTFLVEERPGRVLKLMYYGMENTAKKTLPYYARMKDSLTYQ